MDNNSLSAKICSRSGSCFPGDGKPARASSKTLRSGDEPKFSECECLPRFGICLKILRKLPRGGDKFPLATVRPEPGIYRDHRPLSCVARQYFHQGPRALFCFVMIAFRTPHKHHVRVGDHIEFARRKAPNHEDCKTIWWIRCHQCLLQKSIEAFGILTQYFPNRSPVQKRASHRTQKTAP